MKLIEELELISDDGNGFIIRFYDTEEVEISYFQENHCIDYVFVSMGTWEAFFNDKSLWHK